MEHGECDLDHLLKLHTNPSKLTGTLDTRPFDSIKGVCPDALEAFLTGNGVLKQFLDTEALVELCDEILSAPLEHHSKVVARGTPAVNGDSVTYTITDELTAQFDAIKQRLASLQDGQTPPPATDEELGETESEVESINFYDQMSFVVVQQGDPIAIKSKRSLGSDGSDIFGKTIPAHEGKTNDGVLDDSIIVADDGACTAAISGVLSADISHISISNELVIHDDVDFKTGRIVFPGSVSVGGSVRDRFSIIAEDSIEIRGLVESAALESAKDINLGRGWRAKNPGQLQRTTTSTRDISRASKRRSKAMSLSRAR